MGDLVLSGSTSGSVTLTPPATAGSTTLTLPATSGTVITGPGGVTQVAAGGTGASTLTANNVILGNGTSAVQFVAPGSSGNVLTSNGTTWTSAAAGGGDIQTQLFTAPGTWTNPGSVTQVRVTVVGGGGGGSGPGSLGASGTNGGFAVAICPVSGPVAVTVGAGGSTSATTASPYPAATAGGPSAFGSPSLVSATGGGVSGGSNGSGTVTTGTALKTGNISTITGGAFGVLAGASQVPSGGPAGITYTTSLAFIAGAAGRGQLPGSTAGVSGAVVVEWVG